VFFNPKYLVETPYIFPSRNVLQSKIFVETPYLFPSRSVFQSKIFVETPYLFPSRKLKIFDLVLKQNKKLEFFIFFHPESSNLNKKNVCNQSFPFQRPGSRHQNFGRKIWSLEGDLETDLCTDGPSQISQVNFQKVSNSSRKTNL